MELTETCPCQSGRSFQDCCAPYLQGDSLPATPEALMRSRYTAYSLANIDYIQQTMAGKAAKGFDPVTAKAWASQVTWRGLIVIRSLFAAGNKDIGYVEFLAKFDDPANASHHLHEMSEFKKHNGRWFYVDGEPGKFKRNADCLCGSGKMFKKCCGV